MKKKIVFSSVPKPEPYVKPKTFPLGGNVDSIRQIFKSGDVVTTMSNTTYMVIRKVTKKKVDHYDLCCLANNKVVKNIPYYFLKLVTSSK